MKITTHRLAGHCAAAALSVSILAVSAQADEIDILIGTTNYVPFSTSLTAGTAVYLNADNNPALTDIRATQRSLGAGFTPFDTYTLLDWTGATPVGLEASDFTASVPQSGYATFEIVNNSLRATVVPEPSAFGLLGLGALVLVRRRRK